MGSSALQANSLLTELSVKPKLMQAPQLKTFFVLLDHFCILEKEKAAHSSVLAWRIPGTEEPGGLPSMGSHRVGHD